MGDAASPSRIDDELVAQAARSPDAVALVDGDELTYADLLRRAQGFARALRERGVELGGRVAVYLDKTAHAVAALYGTWLAGGVAVPVHDALKARQVDHIVEHAGARLIVSRRRLLRRAHVDFGERFVDAQAVSPLAPGEGLEVGASTGGASSGAGSVDTGSVDTDGLAALLYTSGSTGRPKGIAVSHENLLAGSRIVSSYLELAEDERILSVLPFSFDYGLNQLLSSVHRGATLVLQRSHLPADICRALEQHRITGLAGVPPLWIQLMGSMSPLRELELPHLRYITNSGGVFPVDLVRQYRAHLPHVRIYLMYGLTEAFRSTYLPPHEIDHRPSSMGKAIPETRIFVLHDDGDRECGPEEVGELVHEGPTVSLGYYRDPEATARVFRPHPFDADGSRVVFSGDRVRRDRDGYLYFVGRRDQLLKCHGHRVSPDEVEEQLFASGLVAEVAVTGEPDEVAGTVVVAHVVPRARGEDPREELDAFCRRELPRYMWPARVDLYDALPKTSSGKLDRTALRPAGEPKSTAQGGGP